MIFLSFILFITVQKNLDDDLKRELVIRLIRWLNYDTLTPRAAGRVPREASGAAAKEKPTWRRVLPKPPTALHTHTENTNKEERTQNKHTHQISPQSLILIYIYIVINGIYILSSKVLAPNSKPSYGRCADHFVFP